MNDLDLTVQASGLAGYTLYGNGEPDKLNNVERVRSQPVLCCHASAGVFSRQSCVVVAVWQHANSLLLLQAKHASQRKASALLQMCYTCLCSLPP